LATPRHLRALFELNPSGFQGAHLPVDSVSWRDSLAWLNEANLRSDGLGLRFPTEAEWEYACRAGTTLATYRGENDEVTLNAIAWHKSNSGGSTKAVKKKAPNAWGLYDMLGNVSEWCADNQRRFTEAGVEDPHGGTGSKRVVRGASWTMDTQALRAAFRAVYTPGNFSRSIGFRLARDA